MDILGTPPVTVAEACHCAGGTLVKSREIDWEMATRIDCWFLAMSDALLQRCYLLQFIEDIGGPS